MGIFSLNKKPTTDFLDYIITDSTAQEIAIKELALHIATSMIADLISRCKVRCFINGKEVENEFTYAMNLSPNPNMPASRMWQKIIASSYDNDDGAILVPYKTGGTQCYTPADSYCMEKKPFKENLFSEITVEDFSMSKTYKEGELFHFKFENAKLKQYVNEMYSQYGELLAFALANYKNKNGQKYIWETDGQQTGDPDFEAKYKDMVKTNLASFIDNANSVLPIHKGQKITDFSNKSSQSSDDIIKLQKNVFDTIAQIFKIPQSLFYGNVTNADQIFNETITMVVAPHTTLIGQELTRKADICGGAEGYSHGNFIYVDPTTIKVQDIMQLASNISGLVGSGAFSPNDIHELLGKPKINEPWADKYYMTKNFALAEDISNGTDTGGTSNGQE